jgi:hypothetical protein
VAILLFKNWIQTLELDAGIAGGELPVHGDARSVAACFPGGSLLFQGGLVWDAPVKTLASQH